MRNPFDLCLAAALLVWCAPARAGCPLDPSDLARSLVRASDAYADLDVDAFRETFTTIRAEVPCLAGTLDGDVAAQLHYAYALDAFLVRDQDRMLRALRGVLAAQPDFAPSEEVARPGSGLFVAFELARHPRDPLTVALPGGRWVIDGVPGAERVPIDQNALVQRVDSEPIATWYVDGPRLPEGLAPHTTAAQGLAAPPRRRSRALLATGIGLGVAAGAALGGAAVLKDRYFDEEDPPSNPTAVRTWNHAIGVSGWVFVAGAAGLGASAVIAGEW